MDQVSDEIIKEKNDFKLLQSLSTSRSISMHGERKTETRNNYVSIEVKCNNKHRISCLMLRYLRKTCVFFINGVPFITVNKQETQAYKGTHF